LEAQLNKSRTTRIGIFLALLVVAATSVTSFAWATATITAQSVATTITPANPNVTVPVTISRPTTEGVRGYSVTIQLSGSLQLSTPVTSGNTGSILQGTFFNGFTPTSFDVIDKTGGVYQVDCAILGTPCGPTSTSGTLFTIGVTSVSATACQGTVTVVTSAVAPVSPRLRDCNNVALAAVAGPAGTVPIDRNAPVITLNGTDMTVECHSTFTDPGATATDLCAGSVPVTVTGSVDPNTPGFYVLTYHATDGFNPATATRNVHVVDTTAPSLTLTAPNGGETWVVGTSQNITWTATDVCSGVGTLDLYYSTDGGATYPNLIASGLANTGSYAWTIPNAPTTTARVQITARDLSNNAATVSSAANFTITAPTAITDLTATRTTSGNDGDGTTKIQLSWTATLPGTSVKLYRKAYGGYPSYASGSVPPAPGSDPPAGWTLAQTVSGVSSVFDEVSCPDRDYYYYVAYVTVGGSTSAASNVTTGTLNYYLGDVVGGGSCSGDNQVNIADVSLLGAHYGATSPGADYLATLDVGPTTNSGPDGRPMPDGRLEFEDLVIFALNFGAVSAPARAHPASLSSATGLDAISLEAPSSVTGGGTITAHLMLNGSGTLRALSTRLAWDPAVVRPVGISAGDWLTNLGGIALSGQPGHVDAALLGGATMDGTGDLATVSFQVLAAGNPQITIAAVDGRDSRNQKVMVSSPVGVGTARPRTTGLLAAQPNPFHAEAQIAFTLAQRGAVSLAIYSPSGRRVRTLASEVREAGEYRENWNGRDDHGSLVSPGVYYARLRAGATTYTHSLVYLK
jgi:hypothetical protein